MAKKKTLGYEDALHKLEQIMGKVENEEIPVDQLTDLVNESMELLKICKAKLKGAENKIETSFKELED